MPEVTIEPPLAASREATMRQAKQERSAADARLRVLACCNLKFTPQGRSSVVEQRPFKPSGAVRQKLSSLVNSRRSC